MTGLSEDESIRLERVILKQADVLYDLSCQGGKEREMVDRPNNYDLLRKLRARTVTERVPVSSLMSMTVPDQDCHNAAMAIMSLEAEVSSLRAENERLTQERDSYKARSQAAEAALAEMRERVDHIHTVYLARHEFAEARGAAKVLDAIRSLANKEGTPTTFPKCRKEPVDVRDFIRKNKEGE